MSGPFAGKAGLLEPSLGLLCKLGSIVVHADEATEERGHQFDIVAIRNVLADPEVKAWIKAMTKKGYLPVKRSAR